MKEIELPLYIHIKCKEENTFYDLIVGSEAIVGYVRT
jgi:hypothetical protein